MEQSTDKQMREAVATALKATGEFIAKQGTVLAELLREKEEIHQKALQRQRRNNLVDGFLVGFTAGILLAIVFFFR